MMKGISVDEFDNSDYYELTEGLNAVSPEDRTQSLEDFMGLVG